LREGRGEERREGRASRVAVAMLLLMDGVEVEVKRRKRGGFAVECEQVE
jgi:hypothetical protein